MCQGVMRRLLVMRTSQKVLELLEEVGYEGWYVLEQDVMFDAEPHAGGGPYEDVRKSLEFLQAQLNGEVAR